MREFLIRVLLIKLAMKFVLASLVFFVGTFLGRLPNKWGIIGALLFFFTYFTTYTYNDLIDFEKDLKKSKVYRGKALVYRYATERDYTILLGNLGIFFAFLTTLWDPLLGAISVIAVLTNNLRSHIKNKAIRQTLLIIVELLNFEAFWQAFYGTTIPFIFLPLFISFSSIYATAHLVYKTTDNFSTNGFVKLVKEKKEIQGFTTLTILAIITTIPAVALSTYHLISLILAVILFSIFQTKFISQNEEFYKIEKKYLFTRLVLGILFFTSAIIYLKIGAPFNKAIPFVDKLEPLYNATNYFDILQKEVIAHSFGKLVGIKEIVK